MFYFTPAFLTDHNFMFQVLKMDIETKIKIVYLFYSANKNLLKVLQ